MTNEKTETKTSLADQDEIQRRKQASEEKFKKNYEEFMNKPKIKNQPCVRSTFLTSIPSSLVIGLITYLVTSRAKMASHVSFGSLWAITGVYFVHCKNEFDKKLKENAELGEIMNLIIKYRGTELEDKFQETYREKVKQMDSKSKYV